MNIVTPEYLEKRFSTFVEKYRHVLKSLGFDAADIKKDVANLKRRLATRDFRLYGDKLIHVLHGGKRITRFYIKLALEVCPAQKAKQARLLDEYRRIVAEARARNPMAQFFSFEAAYGGKLAVPLGRHRELFKL